VRSVVGWQMVCSECWAVRLLSASPHAVLCARLMSNVLMCYSEQCAAHHHERRMNDAPDERRRRADGDERGRPRLAGGAVRGGWRETHGATIGTRQHAARFRPCCAKVSVERGATSAERRRRRRRRPLRPFRRSGFCEGTPREGRVGPSQAAHGMERA